MATTYINPTAPPGGDGSIGAPFNAWASVTWADNGVYLQLAGSTYSGPSIIPTSNYVTIGAYNTTADAPRAIFNGVNCTAGKACIVIPASSIGITVLNFEIFGGVGYGHISSAASTPLSVSTTIRGCKLHDTTPFDAFDSDAIALYSTDVLIEDCEIYNVADDAIWLQDAGSPTVRRCRIYNVGTNPSRFTGDCIQFSRHDGTATVQSCYLENKRDKQCVLGGNNGGALHVYDTELVGGAWGINTNLCLGNIEVKRCKFTATLLAEVAGTPSGGVFHQGISNLLVDHCAIDCAGTWGKAIYCTAAGTAVTVTVSNCTLINNADISTEGLITLYNSRFTLAASNTVFQTDQRTYWSTVNCQGPATFTNCRFRDEYYAFVWVNNVRYATIAAFEAAGYGSANSVANPTLATSMRPRPGSTVLSGGSATPLRDCDGKQSVGHLGAYGVAKIRKAL